MEEGRRVRRTELPKEKIGMGAGELEGGMYILYQGGKMMKRITNTGFPYEYCDSIYI